MADFFRVSVTDDNFIRGAARLMVANITVAFPTAISDIISSTSYDAQAGWNDLGATKTGVTFSHNNTEETFDVDQILGDIDSRPVSYEQIISTQLAEMTLERLQVAWEGGPITTSGSERSMGVGEPPVYTRRRLAILFQKANGKLRAQVFRRVQKSPQESSIAYNKTGEQQSVPVRFRALADTSISDVYTRTQVIFDQT